MMVPVHAVEHFDAHSEEPSSFPFVYAGLHEPGRRSVPERVRSDPSGKTSQACGRLE